MTKQGRRKEAKMDEREGDRSKEGKSTNYFDFLKNSLEMSKAI